MLVNDLRKCVTDAHLRARCLANKIVSYTTHCELYVEYSSVPISKVCEIDSMEIALSVPSKGGGFRKKWDHENEMGKT